MRSGLEFRDIPQNLHNNFLNLMWVYLYDKTSGKDIFKIDNIKM